MAMLNLGDFVDAEFKADAYLQTTLASQNDAGVRDLREKLHIAKSAAAGDLQKNVYKNYGEFVAISKEISGLEGDFLVLRSLLGELSAANAVFRGADPAFVERKEESSVPATSEKPGPETISKDSSHLTQPVRSPPEEGAVALAEFYDSVEGLQKLLPASRAQSVAFDGTNTRFYEVHPATFRQGQAVQLHLLHNMLLITTKKKSIMASARGVAGAAAPMRRLVAERCMPLAEIAIIDMKDSAEVTDAFKIMCHPDAFVFRGESAAEKARFLGLLKRHREKLQEDSRREDLPANRVEE
ncbi:exocyst complex component exo84, partial [Cladochytrium tenue]